MSEAEGSVDTLALSADDWERLSRVLTPGRDIDDALRRKLYPPLASAWTATREGWDDRSDFEGELRELQRIEEQAKQLADSVRTASGQSWLRLHDALGGEPKDLTNRIEAIAIDAHREHAEYVERNKPSKRGGRREKLTPTMLAFDLSLIWREHRADRGWGHRPGAPWHEFVKVAFDIAGVDASTEYAAQKAAKRARGWEKPAE